MKTISPNKKARLIYEKMMENDRFSAWLGLELEEITEGKCRLHYRIREEMLSGFQKVHGGILFAASDPAFAFACNSHGLATLALEASMHFLKTVPLGEKLTVIAEMVHLGNKTGLYEVNTYNEAGELVCQFNGRGYRSSNPKVQFKIG